MVVTVSACAASMTIRYMPGRNWLWTGAATRASFATSRSQGKSGRAVYRLRDWPAQPPDVGEQFTQTACRLRQFAWPAGRAVAVLGLCHCMQHGVACPADAALDSPGRTIADQSGFIIGEAGGGHENDRITLGLGKGIDGRLQDAEVRTRFQALIGQ